MNNTELKGFKEGLIKEANPAAIYKGMALAKGLKTVTSKTNPRKLLDALKTPIGAALAGAGVLTGAGVATAATDKEEKKASLSKEAAGRMSKGLKAIKDIATGKQARESYAKGQRVADQVRKKGINATRAQSLDNAEKGVFKGVAKTTGLYGTGAAGSYAGYSAIKDPKN